MVSRPFHPTPAGSRHKCGRGVLVIVAVVVLLVGCAGAGRSVDREGHMSKAEARADVHKRVDALAKQVGRNPEEAVDGTEYTDNTAQVQSYVYNVRVDVDDDAWERVRGPIAEDLRQQGYTVREDEDTNMRFLYEDGRTLGVTVFAEDGYAIVRGATLYAADD